MDALGKGGVSWVSPARWASRHPLACACGSMFLPFLLTLLLFMVPGVMKLNQLGNFYPRSALIAEQEDAFNLLEAGVDRSNEQKPLQSEPGFHLFAVYLSESGNIFNTRDMNAMYKFEQEFLNYPHFEKFCFLDRSDVNNTKCYSPDSVVSLFNRWGLYENGQISQERINAGVAQLQNFSGRSAILSKDFDGTARTASASKMLIPFAFPLEGFKSAEQRDCSLKKSGQAAGSECPRAQDTHGKTQRDLLGDWMKGVEPVHKGGMLDILNRGIKDNEDNLEIVWVNEILTNEQVLKDVAHDLIFFSAATAVVYIFMAFQMWSLFLATFGLLHVLMSFPTAWFVYHVILRFEYMTQMNLLALFVVLAVGADDVFVFTDAFKQSAYEKHLRHRDFAVETENRMVWTYRRSVKAMGVTSVTTAIAFFSAAFSPIPSIRALCVFTGVAVCINFVLVCTYYPAVVACWHQYICCVKPRTRVEDRESSVDESEDEDEMEGRDDEKGELDGPMVPAGYHETGIDLMGSSNVAVEKDSADEMRIVERFFHRYYAPYVFRFRYFVLALVVVVAVTFLAFGVQVEPLQEQPSFFPDDYSFNRINIITAEYFERDPDANKISAFLVWGVDAEKPIDRSGVDNNDEENQGAVRYDDAFNPRLEASQQCIVDTCARARQQLSAQLHNNEVDCFMEAFRDWVVSNTSTSPPGSAFPVSPDLFDPLLLSFLLDESDEGGSPRTRGLTMWSEHVGLDESSRVQWFRVRLNTSLPPRFGVDLLDTSYDEFSAFQEANNNVSPPGVDGMFHATTWGLWTFLELTKSLVQSAMVGCAVSLVLAFLIMTVATGNVVLAAYATVVIATIIVSVLGFIVMAGWKLGVMESICLTVLVGLAVDYVVHLAHSYNECESKSRFVRIQAALTEMGVSVLGGAFTTAATSSFMFPAIMILFTRFASIIVFATIASLFYSLTFFVAILAVIGPTREFGSVRLIFEKLCNKKT